MAERLVQIKKYPCLICEREFTSWDLENTGTMRLVCGAGSHLAYSHYGWYPKKIEGDSFPPAHPVAVCKECAKFLDYKELDKIGEVIEELVMDTACRACMNHDTYIEDCECRAYATLAWAAKQMQAAAKSQWREANRHWVYAGKDITYEWMKTFSADWIDATYESGWSKWNADGYMNITRPVKWRELQDGVVVNGKRFWFDKDGFQVFSRGAAISVGSGDSTIWHEDHGLYRDGSRSVSFKIVDVKNEPVPNLHN